MQEYMKRGYPNILFMHNQVYREFTLFNISPSFKNSNNTHYDIILAPAQSPKMTFPDGVVRQRKSMCKQFQFLGNVLKIKF